MPKTIKICKACGKEYEACHTPNPGVFRWRDIACSYECAMEYIRRVEAARSNTHVEKQTNKTSEADIVSEAFVQDEAVAVDAEMGQNVFQEEQDIHDGIQDIEPASYTTVIKKNKKK